MTPIMIQFWSDIPLSVLQAKVLLHAPMFLFSIFSKFISRNVACTNIQCTTVHRNYFQVAKVSSYNFSTTSYNY